jgi:hypothetical protein
MERRKQQLLEGVYLLTFLLVAVHSTGSAKDKGRWGDEKKRVGRKWKEQLLIYCRWRGTANILSVDVGGCYGPALPCCSLFYFALS